MRIYGDMILLLSLLTMVGGLRVRVCVGVLKNTGWFWGQAPPPSESVRELPRYGVRPGTRCLAAAPPKSPPVSYRPSFRAYFRNTPLWPRTPGYRPCPPPAWGVPPGGLGSRDLTPPDICLGSDRVAVPFGVSLGASVVGPAGGPPDLGPVSSSGFVGFTWARA